MIASPVSSPEKRLAGRWGGSIALLLLAGCTHAPAQTATPPVPWPEVQINGLMHCDYADGILSNCALNSGATLDDVANSLLNGAAVTQ